jgi:copper(I)-binding protein
MITLPRLRTLSVALLLTVPMAQVALAQVTVTDPWVRGTVAEQKATGAFMRLTAPADTRVVEVRSPVAGTVEIHEMKLDNGVMRMRAVPALALPANQSVDLAPGGYHVMLMGLKQTLKPGDSVPLTLVVEGADKQRRNIEVNAPVRALTSPAATTGSPAAASSAAHKH